MASSTNNTFVIGENASLDLRGPVPMLLNAFKINGQSYHVEVINSGVDLNLIGEDHLIQHVGALYYATIEKLELTAGFSELTLNNREAHVKKLDGNEAIHAANLELDAAKYIKITHDATRSFIDTYTEKNGAGQHVIKLARGVDCIAQYVLNPNHFGHRVHSGPSYRAIPAQEPVAPAKHPQVKAAETEIAPSPTAHRKPKPLNSLSVPDADEVESPRKRSSSRTSVLEEDSSSDAEPLLGASEVDSLDDLSSAAETASCDEEAIELAPVGQSRAPAAPLINAVMDDLTSTEPSTASAVGGSDSRYDATGLEGVVMEAIRRARTNLRHAATVSASQS